MTESSKIIIRAIIRILKHAVGVLTELIK